VEYNKELGVNQAVVVGSYDEDELVEVVERFEVDFGVQVIF